MQNPFLFVHIVDVESFSAWINYKVFRVMQIIFFKDIRRQSVHRETLLVVELVDEFQLLLLGSLLKIAFGKVLGVLHEDEGLLCVVGVHTSKDQILPCGLIKLGSFIQGNHTLLTARCELIG